MFARAALITASGPSATLAWATSRGRPARACRSQPRSASRKSRSITLGGSPAPRKPSPWRPTRSSAAGAKPPKSTSGPPGVAGAEPIGPAPSPYGSPAHRRRSRPICSSSRRPRRWKSAPAAKKSSSRAPTPTPRVKRPRGQQVQRRRLLGQDGAVAERGDEDLGLQPDPSRRPGEYGEGDQRFGVVVHEPVEQAEAAEGAVVGAAGPGRQHGGVVDGKAETDLHGKPLEKGRDICCRPSATAHRPCGPLPFCGVLQGSVINRVRSP